MSSPWMLLGLAIFTVAWLLPGHFPPWTAFQQQWASAAGVSVIASAAAIQNRHNWHWPRPAVVFVVLAVLPMLQYIAGQVRFHADAVLPALYILGFALSIAVGSNLARIHGDQWSDGLMAAVLTAALLSTAIALIQWLNIDMPSVPRDPLAPGGRPYANLAQANHLATLLGLGIAAVAYLFERRRIRRSVAILACIWLGWGLLMTQSRTGWLFVACLTVWWAIGHRRLRLSGGAVIAGCGLFALGLGYWTLINEALLLPTPQAFVERTDTSLRSQLLYAMIEAIANSPWIGWGWNQVSHGQLSVALDHAAGQRVFQNAHNIALDLALWAGIPLATVLVLLAISWLIKQRTACHEGPRWSLLLALCAIGVHALTEYPLDYSYFLLSLGLLVGTIEGGSSAARLLPAPVVTAAVPMFVCVSMLGWIGTEYMKVEESARQIRMAFAGVGPTRVADVPPPEVYLLDAPREYHRLWQTPARAGMSPETLTWMGSVVTRNPSSLALLRYAMALGLNGRPGEAERTLRSICNLHPPKRCQEALESWRLAAIQYPELAPSAKH